MADGLGPRPPVGRTFYTRAVLADTGAFLALANQHDQHHDEAVTCLRAIASNRLPLFVSLPTIYESQRRFLFDLGRRAAVGFLESLGDGTVNTIPTLPEDETEALRLIRRYEDLDLTLVDAANMAIMGRLGIGAAFSFDRHYLLAGFIRIPPFHL